MLNANRYYYLENVICLLYLHCDSIAAIILNVIAFLVCTILLHKYF
jgi:hypothetical protein